MTEYDRPNCAAESPRACRKISCSSGSRRRAARGSRCGRGRKRRSGQRSSRRQTTGEPGALPAHLVVDIDDHSCPCCRNGLHRIGEDVSERLDIVPAQLRMIVVRSPNTPVAPARTSSPRCSFLRCRPPAALSAQIYASRASTSTAPRWPTGSAAPPDTCVRCTSGCWRSGAGWKAVQVLAASFLNPHVLPSISEAIARKKSLALIRPKNPRFYWKRKTADEIRTEKERFEKAARQTFDKELAALGSDPVRVPVQIQGRRAA